MKINLAIANRSRVSSTHIVTTVNFQEGGGVTGGQEEVYGTPAVAATAGSINFAVDSFSQRGNISDTIGGKAATAASINTRVGSSYSTFVKPLVALRPR